MVCYTQHIAANAITKHSEIIVWLSNVIAGSSPCRYKSVLGEQNKYWLIEVYNFWKLWFLYTCRWILARQVSPVAEDFERRRSRYDGGFGLRWGGLASKLAWRWHSLHSSVPLIRYPWSWLGYCLPSTWQDQSHP